MEMRMKLNETTWTTEQKRRYLAILLNWNFNETAKTRHTEKFDNFQQWMYVWNAVKIC